MAVYVKCSALYNLQESSRLKNNMVAVMKHYLLCTVYFLLILLIKLGLYMLNQAGLWLEKEPPRFTCLACIIGHKILLAILLLGTCFDCFQPKRIEASIPTNITQDIERSNSTIGKIYPQTDEQFKRNYTRRTLKKSSTLILRSSFKQINLILMGLCSIFTGNEPVDEDSTAKERTHYVKVLDIEEYKADLCTYPVEPEDIVIDEFFPETFKKIRLMSGLTNKFLY